MINFNTSLKRQFPEDFDTAPKGSNSLRKSNDSIPCKSNKRAKVQHVSFKSEVCLKVIKNGNYCDHTLVLNDKHSYTQQAPYHKANIPQPSHYHDQTGIPKLDPNKLKELWRPTDIYDSERIEFINQAMKSISEESDKTTNLCNIPLSKLAVKKEVFLREELIELLNTSFKNPKIKPDASTYDINQAVDLLINQQTYFSQHGPQLKIDVMDVINEVDPETITITEEWALSYLPIPLETVETYRLKSLCFKGNKSNLREELEKGEGNAVFLEENEKITMLIHREKKISMFSIEVLPEAKILVSKPHFSVKKGYQNVEYENFNKFLEDFKIQSIIMGNQ